MAERRRYPQWECFPPYGERVSHGYLFDAGGDGDEAVYRSLCGRREVPDSPYDPRSVYFERKGGTRADQPDLEDTYGCCQGCVKRAERFGLLPFRGRWARVAA